MKVMPSNRPAGLLLFTAIALAVAAFAVTGSVGKAADRLSQAQQAGLIQMREEEKLARDVYLRLYERWGQRIFANISASENRHMAAIKVLLDRYNLPDPAANDQRGVFSDPRLQKLYLALIEQGAESLEDALSVGALVEELDLKDLQDLAAANGAGDIKAVYDNLMKGSRNHLRSFNAQLVGSGVQYQAQYLSQAEYEKIAGSQREKGAV